MKKIIFFAIWHWRSYAREGLFEKTDRHHLFIESNNQAHLSSAVFDLLQVVHSLSLCTRNFIG